MEFTSQRHGEQPVDVKVPLWLHCKHGSAVSELEPLTVSRINDSMCPAQSFTTDWQASHSHDGDHKGVSCYLNGLELCVDSGVEDCPFSIPLSFSHVSCVPLSATLWPDLALIAIVPPLNGSGLRGAIIGRRDLPDVTGWCVIAQGTAMYDDLLNRLGEAGCLREDLEAAVLPSPEGECVIGEGAYATVQCMHMRNGTLVAVKKMNLSAEIEAIEREVATLLHCQGDDNVIGFRGMFVLFEVDVPRISLVFDVAPCGDLLLQVLRYGAMTENVARLLFFGLMAGLAYVHERSIVHRDIKAENVLLKRPDLAVLADFGLATWLDNETQMKRRCGSPGYVAPEVCLGTAYGCKADVFGAGVCLYFILSKEMPFVSADRDNAATMRKTVKCNLHLHRPPWEQMSASLRNMLRQTICKSQEDRLSAADSLEHKWLHKGGPVSRAEPPTPPATSLASGPHAPPISPPTPHGYPNPNAPVRPRRMDPPPLAPADMSAAGPSNDPRNDPHHLLSEVPSDVSAQVQLPPYANRTVPPPMPHRQTSARAQAGPPLDHDTDRHPPIYPSINGQPAQA